MANDVTGIPWRLDTVAEILAATNRIRVKQMIWFPNAADNDLIIKDGNAKVKWEVRATTGAPNKESFGIEKFDGGPDGELFDGFELDTIDGGSLDVYIDRPKRR